MHAFLGYGRLQIAANIAALQHRAAASLGIANGPDLRLSWRIREHVDEPLDLQTLAAEVGCSPFYLSRTFSSTTEMTISQYVRKLRIETAAELIVSGQCNVSEAAVEVGYQSLSHFSKAFQQVKGCLPSKYEAA